jgi:hypothetical protein
MPTFVIAVLAPTAADPSRRTPAVMREYRAQVGSPFASRLAWRNSRSASISTRDGSLPVRTHCRMSRRTPDDELGVDVEYDALPVLGNPAGESGVCVQLPAAPRHTDR